jgi:hypothetical protein
LNFIEAERRPEWKKTSQVQVLKETNQQLKLAALTSVRLVILHTFKMNYFLKNNLGMTRMLATVDTQLLELQESVTAS